MLNVSVLSTVPREALNYRFFLCVFTIGILGAARGLDEGIISAETKSAIFQSSFGVEYGSDMQSNITSMLQIAGIGGSILAWFNSDRFGRVRAAQISCVLWIVGCVIWLTATSSVAQLLIGRFIAGLGVGGTVVSAPTYLAEISPKSLRGAVVGVFSSTVYVGILLGYATNLGAAKRPLVGTTGQFQVPISLNLMFAVLTMAGSFFVCESPRWLLKRGRDEDAVKAMCWIRNLREEHPYVRQELDGMREVVRIEREAMGENWRWWMSWRDMFTSKENLYILALVCGCQLFGQFSGGGSLTVYAPELFEIVSGQGGNVALFTTVIFGVIKLVASLLAGFFILDLLGRKRAAFIGITLQAMASLYIAIYLFLVPTETEEQELAATPSQKRAGVGAIAMIFVSGIGWVTGFNSIQYLLASEMYPINVRSLGTMLAMATHWLMQYGSSRSVNAMLDTLKPSGTFLFWGVESILCFFLVLFFIPETAGRSLEEMHELFAKPWYKIGISANKPVRGRAINELGADEMAYEQEATHAREGSSDEKKSDEKTRSRVQLRNE